LISKSRVRLWQH